MSLFQNKLSTKIHHILKKNTFFGTIFNACFLSFGQALHFDAYFSKLFFSRLTFVARPYSDRNFLKIIHATFVNYRSPMALSINEEDDEMLEDILENGNQTEEEESLLRPTMRPRRLRRQVRGIHKPRRQ